MSSRHPFLALITNGVEFCFGKDDMTRIREEIKVLFVRLHNYWKYLNNNNIAMQSPKKRVLAESAVKQPLKEGSPPKKRALADSVDAHSGKKPRKEGSRKDNWPPKPPQPFEIRHGYYFAQKESNQRKMGCAKMASTRNQPTSPDLFRRYAYSLAQGGRPKQNRTSHL